MYVSCNINVNTINIVPVCSNVNHMIANIDIVYSIQSIGIILLIASFATITLLYII